MDTNEINDLINYWEEETCFDSSPGTDNECYHKLLDIASYDKTNRNRVIITALNHLKREQSFRPFVLLWELVPEEEHPKFPETEQGYVDKCKKIWLKWGVEKGLIKE